MDDPENVKTMLDIILSQNTNLKQSPQTEKEQRTSTDNRQIRLDVYAIDEDDVIYEVEAQKENTHNLPKRSRLYQGIIDSKLLPPGVVDFNLLNEVLIVMITPFDLFGYGLYRYTFQMRCEEVPELKLDDGATRIFLNTKGKHPELVSQELIELLKYMEHSTDEVSEQCKSERIQKMHRRVCRIKASEKTEVKYMQAWEGIRTPFTGSLVDGKCCCRNSNFSGTGSKSTGSFIISVVFTFCPCASVKGDSQIRKYWIKRIGNDYGRGFICRNVSFILNQERVGQASVFSNRYRTDRFCDT